jgi:hypothetical protein
MDRTDEAGRTSTCRADPARGYPPATITELTGADAKVVFVMCHEMTMDVERHRTRAEIQSAYCSVETLAPAKLRLCLTFSTSQATALEPLKENDN